MRLTAGSTELGLTIDGYQYPENPDNKHDANWLFIRIELAHPDGGTSKVEPALLTWEVETLAGWLEAAASGAAEPPELSFTESALSFALLPEYGAVRAIIDRGEFEATFMAEPAMLQAAAASLREQLARYPKR